MGGGHQSTQKGGFSCVGDEALGESGFVAMKLW